MQITIDQLRRHLGHFVAKAAYGGERIEVTRHGRPAITISGAIETADDNRVVPKILAARTVGGIETGALAHGAARKS